MLKEKMDHVDRNISNYLSAGVKEEILRLESLKYRNKKDYYMIFVRELRESEINDVDEHYNDEERSNYGFSNTYYNKIYLEATTISFDNLWCAAQVSLDGFKKAYLSRDVKDIKDSDCYVREALIIYYKDVNDIDFTDYELNGLSLSSAEDDFTEKYNKRNIDGVIKKYRDLMDNLSRQTNYANQIRQEIEDFKKGLSEEELLAISVL